MFGFFAEEAGLLGQPLVRGLGFVVGAGVASGLGAAPPVGLPRGQEQVLAQVHIPPQLVEQRQLIGGVVAVAEGGLAHDVAVLLLHVRVVVGGVRPRAGHEDHPLGAPGDQGVVDELSAVVTVQPDHRVRQPVSDLRDGRNDPGVGAVADGDVHGPPEVDVGSGQRPGVLTLEGVPAVSDQVDLEEPWGLLHLVHRLTYHDRRTQRGPGTGRGLRRGVPGVLGGFEHPVDRGRAHRHQLLTHLGVEPLSDLAQLTEGLQLGQGGGHDRGQVLPARLPDQRPHLDQDLEGVIPVRARPWLALDRPGRAPAPGRRRDRPPGIGPRPARDRDELVEHPAPVLLRSALVLLRLLPRDLMTCRHRQPLTHPPSTPQRPKQDPGFASSSPVRHAPHFASTLGESRRATNNESGASYPADCEAVMSGPTSNGRPGLLTGMRVVEGSAFVAAPLGGMTLAQLGADVIRFDQIGGGLDRARWPLAHDGQSLFWAGLNKGKRSIALDLSTPAGRELAVALVTAPGPDGGLFLTNFPARGWLSYERLCARRTDLVMVALTGNPDGTSVVDYTVNPATGFPLATGPRDYVGPLNSVLPAWDIAMGTLAAVGLLAAERRRTATGQGELVRLALSDVAFAMVGNLGRIAEAQLGGQDHAKDGNYLYGAFGHDFETRDGRRVMVVALTGRQWDALQRVTGTTEAFETVAAATEHDFTTEGGRFEARDLVAAMLAPWFRARDLTEIREAFAGSGVSWGPYQSFAQLVAHDPRCSLDNPMFAEIEHPGVGTYLAPGCSISANIGLSSEQRGSWATSC